MLKQIGVAALATGLLLAAGCSPKPKGPTVNESMTKVVAPQMQTIWDITNAALNAKGDGIDPARISDADWAKLAAAGQLLQDRALLLASLKHVVAAGPGETIMGEDASGAPSKQGHAWDAATSKQVQAFIDGNPTLFAQRARILADNAAIVVKSAKARDVKPLYEVSAGMDEVCDGCHEKFWGTDEPPPFPNE
jgi:hypothetical protein